VRLLDHHQPLLGGEVVSAQLVAKPGEAPMGQAGDEQQQRGRHADARAGER